MTRILVLLFALLTPTWALATTYYIDPTCTSFNGDGTTTACASSGGGVGAYNAWPVPPNITGANSYLQKRGTTVLTRVTVNSGASASQPVTIGAYGTGAKPIIRSEENADTGSIQIATNAANIVIDGIEVHGQLNLGAGVQSNAIRNNATNNAVVVNITVQNCTIGPVVGFGGSDDDDGIDLRGQGLIIQDNTFVNIANDAVWLDTSTGVGAGPIIRRNTCSLVSQVGTSGDCYQIAGSGSGALIEHNYCDHSDVDSKNCIISNDSAVIRYNEVHGPVVSTVYIGIYCDLGASCEVYGNESYNGKLGIANFAATTGLVYGNLVVNATTYGIETTAPNVIVSHNTVDNPGPTHAAIRMTSAATNGRAFNNIVSDAFEGVRLTSGSGQTETTNMFHGTIGTRVYNTTTAGSIAATNGIDATSQFVNETGLDYRTKSTSTARRAGLATGACKDVRGRVCYPSAPDIGAYQASSGDQAASRTARTP